MEIMLVVISNITPTRKIVSPSYLSKLKPNLNLNKAKNDIISVYVVKGQFYFSLNIINAKAWR